MFFGPKYGKLVLYNAKTGRYERITLSREQADTVRHILGVIRLRNGEIATLSDGALRKLKEEKGNPFQREIKPGKLFRG